MPFFFFSETAFLVGFFFFVFAQALKPVKGDLLAQSGDSKTKTTSGQHNETHKGSDYQRQLKSN